MPRRPCQAASMRRRCARYGRRSSSSVPSGGRWAVAAADVEHGLAPLGGRLGVRAVRLGRGPVALLAVASRRSGRTVGSETAARLDPGAVGHGHAWRRRRHGVAAFCRRLRPHHDAGGPRRHGHEHRRRGRLVGQPGRMVRFHALFNAGASPVRPPPADSLRAGLSWRWVWAVVGAGATRPGRRATLRRCHRRRPISSVPAVRRSTFLRSVRSWLRSFEAIRLSGS